MTFINQLNPCATLYSAEYFESEKSNICNLSKPVIPPNSSQSNFYSPFIYQTLSLVILPNSLQSIIDINKTSNINQTNFIKNIIDFSISTLPKELSKLINKHRKNEITDLIIKFQDTMEINYSVATKEAIHQFIKFYLIKEEYNQLDKRTQRKIQRSLKKGVVFFERV